MTKTKFSRSRYCIMALICFLTIVSNVLNAQSLKLNPKTFSMIIMGTTNVHDFESKVTQANGELVVKGSKQVQSLVVEIPVRSIKSGEKVMDNKTYETFNDKQYPTITFRMLEVNPLNVTGNDINVTVIGNLTMAGVTKKISMISTGKIIKPGVYEFKGTVNLKMSEFKMKKPTAMLGMMKVGDAITLKYNVTFEGAPIN